MKKLIVIAVCIITTITYAQTATPHPNTLSVGLYQFEDLSSPEMELTGNWYISGNTLASDQTDSTATFYVDEFADYLIIHRGVTNTLSGTWSICVDSAMCGIISDYGNGGIEPVAYSLLDTNSEIVITKLDDNPSGFDFMEIAVGSNAITSPVIVYVPLVATPIATTTPETMTFISGTDGNYTRIDNSVTTGEQFIGIVLTMMFVVSLVRLAMELWQK